MRDEAKSKEQLMEELREVRRQLAESERSTEESKRTEEALRESEERFRSLVETSFDWVWEVDVHGRYTFVSPNVRDTLGYSAEEILGRTPFDLMPEEEARRVEAIFSQIAATRQCFFALENVNRHRDGRSVVLESSGVPIFGFDGEYKGYRGMGRDVTDRRRVEAERVRLEAENRQLLKAESLGRMAGAISHLFNNHLAVVISNLELALMDLPDNAVIHEYVMEAIRAARRSSEISMLMLTYLGQSVSKGELLDLSDICRQSLKTLYDALPEGVILKTGFPASGPVVRAHISQIQQVLTNLVTNGWESMGGGPGTITLATRTVRASELPCHLRPVGWKPAADAFACLEVTDTGCGIAQEDLDKIFDPFFTTKFTGRGLGLAVVLGIAKSCNGAVSVEKTENSGSTFRVFLPLVPEESPHLSRGEAPPRAMEPGGTVLLVEDQDTARLIARAVLKRLGYEVIDASSGSEAIDLFRQDPDRIRCVITDLGMPEMDGWETLAALRKIRANIPVILVSGYDEAYAMAGSSTEQPQAFLQKPYSKGDLRTAIETALRKAEPPGQAAR